MDNRPAINELVSRWQQLRQQGQPVSLEEFCADCPEQLVDLKRRLQQLASMQAFLQLSQENPGAATPPQGSHDAFSTINPPGRTPCSHQEHPPDLPDLVPGYELLRELGRGEGRWA